jgi:radical SAM protein with 4Fe4S-binding SPASM domain
MIDKGLQVYEVNLAVANVCNASCLYCPRSFVDSGKKFMDVDLVKRIMKEVGSWKFLAEHPVVHSVCSENGEPFLNPNILDILGIVRSTQILFSETAGAKIGITMFSNFGVLTEDIAREVIKNHLFDSIHVNVDGATPESYRAVKGLDLETVEENIKTFIRIRDEMNVPIRVLIHIISHYTYSQSVKTFFRVPPVKGNGKYFPQDGPEVYSKWMGMINPALDAVGEDSVMFWAERYNDHPIPTNNPCPNIGRVRHVAYINPEGNLYACCFDAGNDLVVGNINDSSILEILQSEKRKELIRRLEERKWGEIGWPCTRVDACQGYSRGEVK